MGDVIVGHETILVFLNGFENKKVAIKAMIAFVDEYPCPNATFVKAFGQLYRAQIMNSEEIKELTKSALRRLE